MKHQNGKNFKLAYMAWQGGRRRQVLVRMGEVIFAIVDDHETLINRSAK